MQAAQEARPTGREAEFAALQAAAALSASRCASLQEQLVSHLAKKNSQGNSVACKLESPVHVWLMLCKDGHCKVFRRKEQHALVLCNICHTFKTMQANLCMRICRGDDSHTLLSHHLEIVCVPRHMTDQYCVVVCKLGSTCTFKQDGTGFNTTRVPFINANKAGKHASMQVFRRTMPWSNGHMSCLTRNTP